MEVCYWALLFMPLVILHHLLNVFVQLANKRGFTKKKNYVWLSVRGERGLKKRRRRRRRMFVLKKDETRGWRICRSPNFVRVMK
jgi:hypothetical protein